MIAGLDDVDPDADARRLKQAAIVACVFVGLLWLVMLVNQLVGADLAKHGIFPRALHALPGIIFAPLIHSSFVHLLANTPPLLVLGTATLYLYPRAARWMLPSLYVGSGVAVWLFARSAYHIGASGVTHGLLFFLLIAGMLRRDRRSMGIAMVVLFLYGGMIWGILPAEPGVSFESHLAGAVLGVLAAVVLRHRDPLPPRRRYSWEDEDLDIEDLAPVQSWDELDRATELRKESPARPENDKS